MEYKENKPANNYREYKKALTISDRGLSDYESILDFDKNDFKGKTVLDLGSGQTERFSRELKDFDNDTEIVSLNPDYSINHIRKRMPKSEDHQKMSVAAIAQDLPFGSESFDRIVALYSVPWYYNPQENPEAYEAWISEIIRVLKPKGIARLGPVFVEDKNIGDVTEKVFEPFLNKVRNENLNVRLEKFGIYENGDPVPKNKQADAYNYRLIFKRL
jgi:ubiquinone/menaquinone biosynthesis C-methylase UbiE